MLQAARTRAERYGQELHVRPRTFCSLSGGCSILVTILPITLDMQTLAAESHASTLDRCRTLPLTTSR